MCEDLIKAKDQTITMLADQVDFLRHQLAIAQAATPATAPSALPAGLEQILGAGTVEPAQMWQRDPVEDIEHKLETGEMTTEQAEQALTALQAQTKLNG